MQRSHAQIVNNICIRLLIYIFATQLHSLEINSQLPGGQWKTIIKPNGILACGVIVTPQSNISGESF